MPEFPNTRWSLIDTVVTEAPTGSRDNMGVLMETYWEPMYAHLRYKGISAERAEDLIQDFMIEILSKDLLAVADPQKGKFRTLLLTALDRFAVTKHRYETAAKRSPGNLASLDSSESEHVSADDESPSLAFDRAWALDVLASALARMKEDCEKEGNDARWAIFEQRVLSPLLDDFEIPDYADLANDFELANEKAAMNMLVTAKRQMGRVLRDVIREYIMRRTDEESYVAHIAKRMETSDNSESIVGLARHLTEQAIHRMVEDELEQLQEILARGGNRVASRPRDNASKHDVKSEFWGRLTQNSGTSDSELGRIFAVGAKIESQDDDDRQLDETRRLILAMPLSDLIGGQNSTEVHSCLARKGTSLDELNSLKDWAGQERTRDKAATPREVSDAVFFAAIAAALVHHGEKITVLNSNNLRTEFGRLGNQRWLDVEIQELSRKATEMLD
ncbi:MAG: hypothetical protein AAF802_17870 [Planctomycetota bacterium]